MTGHVAVVTSLKNVSYLLQPSPNLYNTIARVFVVFMILFMHRILFLPSPFILFLEILFSWYPHYNFHCSWAKLFQYFIVSIKSFHISLTYYVENRAYTWTSITYSKSWWRMFEQLGENFGRWILQPDDTILSRF